MPRRKRTPEEREAELAAYTARLEQACADAQALDDDAWLATMRAAADRGEVIFLLSHRIRYCEPGDYPDAAVQTIRFRTADEINAAIAAEYPEPPAD